jgi:hypothetical protein
VTPGGLDHLILSPAAATVWAGTLQSYTATGSDAYGNTLGDVTVQTTLAISPDGAGTAANCYSTGKTCKATKPGTYTITAIDGAATGTATLQVNVDHLVLFPSAPSVTAGTAQAFSVTAFDSYGNSLGGDSGASSFAITRSGPGTGVSCDNMVHTWTASQAGTYTITGTEGTATGTATLTVTPAALDHLVLSPATSTVTAGTGQSYTVAGFDRYGNSLGDVTAATTFITNPNGSGTGASCNKFICTATKAGTYTVTATDGPATGTATLTVTPTALSRLVLSPATATVAARTVQAYTATGFDVYGNSFDITSATSLTITPNGPGTGASCDNRANTCTASKAGTYTITGTDGTHTGTATLQVLPPGRAS